MLFVTASCSEECTKLSHAVPRALAVWHLTPQQCHLCPWSSSEGPPTADTKICGPRHLCMRSKLQTVSCTPECMTWWTVYAVDAKHNAVCYAQSMLLMSSISKRADLAHSLIAICEYRVSNTLSLQTNHIFHDICEYQNQAIGAILAEENGSKALAKGVWLKERSVLCIRLCQCNPFDIWASVKGTLHRLQLRGACTIYAAVVPYVTISVRASCGFWDTHNTATWQGTICAASVQRPLHTESMQSSASSEATYLLIADLKRVC